MIDLTKFLSNKDIKKIYLDEEHNGHFPNYGNKIVSEKILQEIKQELKYV